jgi:hypothetical protein
MSKNTVELGRSQMTVWCMRIACWIPKAVNILRIFNTCSFSAATMVAQKHLNITIQSICLSCSILYRIGISYIKSLHYRDYTINSHIHHVRLINPLNPSGTFIYHQLEHSKTLNSGHRSHLCVLYVSQNKQRLFSYTILNNWFL